MNFEEYAAKKLLIESGIPVPIGRLARSPSEAAAIATEIGPCAIKAQVPTGKRGKAGGILFADSPSEAEKHTNDLLSMRIDGHAVEKVLVEGRAAIAREFYAAILTDTAMRKPQLLFSTAGGMEIEESVKKHPSKMKRILLDISVDMDIELVRKNLLELDLDESLDLLIPLLANLFTCYKRFDGELLEINPLVLTTEGKLLALDCKFVMDDAAEFRQQNILSMGAKEKLTELEMAAKEKGLKYIDLAGSVGVLANGAGLTMTTMDAITHYGGSPANFLEIGGEAYTMAEVALNILLRNKNIRSMLVNFCGAFARTDVMTEGVVKAWQELAPDIPIFFTIHGTGEEEAVQLVTRELGLTPFDLMDDAVKAAVAAAGKD